MPFQAGVGAVQFTEGSPLPPARSSGVRTLREADRATERGDGVQSASHSGTGGTVARVCALAVLRLWPARWST
eukprot:7142644-Prymnesium_polylepis.1